MNILTTLLNRARELAGECYNTPIISITELHDAKMESVGDIFALAGWFSHPGLVEQVGHGDARSRPHIPRYRLRTSIETAVRGSEGPDNFRRLCPTLPRLLRTSITNV